MMMMMIILIIIITTTTKPNKQCILEVGDGANKTI